MYLTGALWHFLVAVSSRAGAEDMVKSITKQSFHHDQTLRRILPWVLKAFRAKIRSVAGEAGWHVGCLYISLGNE